MERLTSNGIEKYLIKNYGRVNHECEKIKISCQKTSRRYGCTAKEVFHFIIENNPIPGLYTHSYGFHTALGREIYEFFKYKYYND